MWLLPVFSPLAAAALRVFYRLEIAGARVPRTGPALVVANHPNSLLDPAAVVAVAGRPVRFLAKAPLFSSPQVGWLIRGAGAIPVNRRQDDPELMERNADTFRAAYDALAAGDVIGLFPEGLSHSDPSLAPLRTGAARIALGAAVLTGRSLPIVPVGLLFGDKPIFRSDALILVGEPLSWDDLAARGGSPEAVRELTARIEQALRQVTVNVERWEDARLVEAAEAVYSAEFPTASRPDHRVRRLGELSRALARIRTGEHPEWEPLAVELRRHDRRLRRLRLRPHQLRAPGASSALTWTVRQLGAALLLVPVAAVGALAYALPYELTGRIADRSAPSHDSRATYKLLIGALAHFTWTLLLALVAGVAAGALAGAVALLLLPAAGLAAVYARDRWHRARGEADRFFVRLRHRRELAEVRAAQRALAERLESARVAGPVPTAGP